MNLNLNNDNYKGLAVGILLTMIVCWILFKGCETPVKPVKNVELDKHIKQADTTQRIIIKMDSIRFIEVVKWRYAKTNPNRLPCDSLYTEIVSICDTIITRDSVQLGQYKKLVGLKDSIISDCQSIIVNKNDTIKLLNKEVKRQKWYKRGVIALWILREGVGVASKLPN